MAKTVAASSNEDSAILRERIQARLEALGLSQLAAAKKAGQNADFVRDILHGRVKDPGAMRLAKLARALETSVSYLLGEAEPVPEVTHMWTGASATKALEPYSPQEQVHRRSVALPIRFELADDLWRNATEVAGPPLGYEMGHIPEGLSKNDTWYERVRDKSFELIAPEGSLVQVVAFEDADRERLTHGDVVVVQARMVGPMAKRNIVQRSLRWVNHRYPDLGLWFLDFAGLDPEMNLSDDVLRDENHPYKAPPEPTGDWSGLAPEDFDFLSGHMTDEKAAKLEAFLAQAGSQRPRVVGRVVSVLMPIRAEEIAGRMHRYGNIPE